MLPRLSGKTRRVGGKGVARFSSAEQEQALAGNQPEPRIARRRYAARDVDRVVAAELRAVDIGMAEENAAVALVAEAPDRAGLRGLEIGAAGERSGVGEESHRVEA